VQRFDAWRLIPLAVKHLNPAISNLKKSSLLLHSGAIIIRVVTR
jgi:hypothetical protein